MVILGKEYNLKYSIRAMFIFEQITEKHFQIQTLLDEYTFFYSCILAGNNEDSLVFNEFIDYCDEHPELLKEFSEFLLKQQSVDGILTGNNVKKKKVKKG